MNRIIKYYVWSNIDRYFGLSALSTGIRTPSCDTSYIHL